MKESLLVVDEEIDVLKSVKSAMKEEGYLVLCARRNSEALNIINNRIVDVLLTSLSFPEPNGLELLQQVRNLSPSTGSIVMCRNDSLDVVIKAIQNGAQAIVLKPVDFPLLKNVIYEVAEKSRMIKERMKTNALFPIYELNKSLITSAGINKLFNRIARIISFELRAKRVMVMLLDSSTNKLVVKATAGVTSDITGKMIDLKDDSIAQSAIKNSKPILIKGQLQNDEITGTLKDVSVICVPLLVKQKIIGVISCYRLVIDGCFTESDLQMLSILASQAAILIEHTRLMNDIVIQKNNVAVSLRKCLTAQEDERRRISAELHDGLVQWMVSALYSVQYADALITMSRYDEARKAMNRAHEIMDQSIKELRRIILDLHPRALADLGLVEGIRHSINNFAEQVNFKVNYVIEGEQYKLSLIQEVTIYRVILEALNNVKKHAHAANVEIILRFSSDFITAEVIDDGDGFNLLEILRDEIEKRKVGLLNMKERAKTVGGTLDIYTAPGKGTKIILTIPRTPDS